MLVGERVVVGLVGVRGVFGVCSSHRQVDEVSGVYACVLAQFRDVLCQLKRISSTNLE